MQKSDFQSQFFMSKIRGIFLLKINWRMSFIGAHFMLQLTLTTSILKTLLFCRFQTIKVDLPVPLWLKDIYPWIITRITFSRLNPKMKTRKLGVRQCWAFRRYCPLLHQRLMTSQGMIVFISHYYILKYLINKQSCLLYQIDPYKNGPFLVLLSSHST